MLFLSACITDETVTTTFRPDGTVTRVVTFKTDDKDYDLKELCTPVDSSWNITMTRDSADTSKFLVRAEKNFGDVQWLNNDYKFVPHALSGVKREISYEKKFMWFYTFYYYQETLYRVFDEKPMSDFLTPEEIRWFMADEDNQKKMLAAMDSTRRKKFDDRVSDRSMQWLAACMFSDFFDGVTTVARQHHADPFTEKNLIASRDSMEKKFMETFSGPEENSNAFGKWFGETFDIDPDSLMTHYPAPFSRYTQKQKLISSVLPAAYENRVTLPGKIYDTNADTLAGNLCSWQVRAPLFLGSDLDMFAAARKSNPWAWAAAALILLFAIGLWFFPKR